MNKENKDLNNTLLLASKRGFSLAEILVALTLIALAGTFVVGQIFDSLYEGQRDSVLIQARGLSERLKEFRRHCGFYPTTDQGLEALIAKPSGRECRNYSPRGYIDGGILPLDPWDQNFVYTSNGEDFNICSLGVDGLEGGEEKDQDICLYPQGGAAQEAP